MSKVFAELVNMGMSNESAIEIQQAILVHDNLVTKDYLRAEIAEIKTEFHKEIASQTKFIVGTMVALTAIFSAIVKLL